MTGNGQARADPFDGLFEADALEQAQAVRNQTANMERGIRVQQLRTYPGWRDFMEDVKSELKGAEAQLVSAREPVDAFRFQGMVSVLKRLVEWEETVVALGAEARLTLIEIGQDAQR